VNGESNRNITLAGLEHPDVRAALSGWTPPARVVLLPDHQALATYAGTRPVSLLLLPAEIDEAERSALAAAQREVHPHGQLLVVAPGPRALEAGRLDPWRGPDAPPPPPSEDLPETITALLEFARVGALTGLIGVSDAILGTIRTVVRIAPADVPVLIRGPSGSGKELVAGGIHRASPRADRPFVAVNTPGLSQTLIESELFGHERGAFTGAVQRKTGVFEAAGEGTIFLDEIGDLSRELQAKLLRVLEQNEFVRVGGTEPIRVKARVLAATNVELERAVAEGRFREDLYYRLQVVTIDLPGLGERPEDVLPLLRHFVTRVCETHGTDFHGFTDEAVAFLQAYPWPGNVRELRNLVEQVVLLHPDRKITSERLHRILEERAGGGRWLPTLTGRTPEQAERDLIFQSLQALRRELGELREEVRTLSGAGAWSGPAPAGGLEGSVAVPLGTPLEEVELRLIEETLRRLAGDKKKTAEVLGIGLRTLYRRLDRLGERLRSGEPGTGAGSPQDV
jgi:two-component system response regulator HydG